MRKLERLGWHIETWLPTLWSLTAIAWFIACKWEVGLLALAVGVLQGISNRLKDRAPNICIHIHEGEQDE